MKLKSFDEAVVIEPNGSETRLTYEQFFKLPLVKRVTMLCDLKVRFYKAGRPVPTAEAVK
jgi:hypothetical protein